MCRPWCRKSPALWSNYVDSAFTESFVTLIAKCHGCPLGSHKDKYVEQNEAELAQNEGFFRVVSSRDVNIVEGNRLYTGLKRTS